MSMIMLCGCDFGVVARSRLCRTAESEMLPTADSTVSDCWPLFTGATGPPTPTPDGLAEALDELMTVTPTRHTASLAGTTGSSYYGVCR